MIVIFLHHALPDTFPGGYFGVDIFFALSGYLITAQLVQEHVRRGSIWLTGFYIRRFLRLTPALMIVVVFALIVHVAVGWGANPFQAAAAATYLMDFYLSLTSHFGGSLAHTWSLAVEEQFYLVWPALLILGIRLRWPMIWVTSFLVVAAIVPTLLVVRAGSYQMAYYSPFAHLGELGAGVLLALIVASDRTSMIRWTRSYAVPVVAVGLLTAASLGADQEWAWQYYGGFTAAGLVTAAVVAHCILRPDSYVTKALGRRTMTWIGERSYGIYLWHYPLLYVLIRYVDDWVALIVGGVLSVVLAALSFRYVEQRFNRIKDTKFATR
ncbi:hypothetical protein GCM10007304_48780 [Rhodococcoides trifolii]|uniref:Acyltransferase 3 domain-containing protein n=1 Tax=Rhodococcoides trifolii TaxID=908250 RepID=A0A917G8U5_9NOCA|nr:hypothetical protein GCM10007304_48780 [Rhodococcus trifolii]